MKAKLLLTVSALLPLVGCGGGGVGPTEDNLLPINGKITLKEDFQGKLTVRDDNTVVDLNGHTIHGPSWGLFSNDPLDTCINVLADNVVIKNGKLGACLTGINIAGRFQRGKDTVTATNLWKTQGDAAAIEYMESFSGKGSDGTIITDMQITPITHAVYIQPYVSDTTIQNSSINKGRIGIYVDSGVQRTLINKVTFKDIGWGKYVSSLRKIVSRPVGEGREAIAIDGAMNTTITNSTFTHTNLASVTAYRNCMENKNSPSAYPRLTGASGISIMNNTFNNEVTGVWLGSRQQRDLSKWVCGNTPEAGGYFMDHATGANITANTFNNTDVAVEIADDDNTVIDNTLNGALVLITPKADDTYPTGVTAQGQD